jgi:hypothetical protein
MSARYDLAIFDQRSPHHLSLMLPCPQRNLTYLCFSRGLFQCCRKLCVRLRAIEMLAQVDGLKPLARLVIIDSQSFASWCCGFITFRWVHTLSQYRGKTFMVTAFALRRLRHPRPQSESVSRLNFHVNRFLFRWSLPSPSSSSVSSASVMPLP